MMFGINSDDEWNIILTIVVVVFSLGWSWLLPILPQSKQRNKQLFIAITIHDYVLYIKRKINSTLS